MRPGADGKANGPSLAAADPVWLDDDSCHAALLVLRFLNEHGIPNWGWDIIIVTVIFNLVMLPTRLMMMKSSLKMMRIQPKVDALKRKYAHLKVSDPKRAEMNTEMMALYKTGERQHVRRLPAAADPDAAVLRLLPGAGQCDRAAAGALVLAARSLRCRPASHSCRS